MDNKTYYELVERYGKENILWS